MQADYNKILKLLLENIDPGCHVSSTSIFSLYPSCKLPVIEMRDLHPILLLGDIEKGLPLCWLRHVVKLRAVEGLINPAPSS